MNSKKKKGKVPDEERRRWPRLKASSVPFLKGVTLGHGTEVQAIDISRGGILIETEVSLRPQMKIDLRLVTSGGIIKLEGTVMRSSITSLNGVPRYQSAIAFKHPFHMLDDLSESPAEEAASEPGSGGSPEIEHGSDQPLSQQAAGTFDESLSALKFSASDGPSAALLEMFKQNDW